MDETSQLGPSERGSVVLDIGGDIGALVLMTTPEMLGAEIEISRADEIVGHTHDHVGNTDHAHGHSHSAARTHVAVRERRGPNGSQYAAIYFGLREGEYTLWGVTGESAGTVTIVGGYVAQVDWR